jgi:transcriptional regulator with XRE-family HTH domain
LTFFCDGIMMTFVMASGRPLHRGTWFRSRRLELRLSLAEVALQVGVQPSTVESWERGERIPKLSRLEDLMVTYGSSRHELIDAIANIALSLGRAA